MGCDIHSFAEQRVDAKWIEAKNFVRLDEYEKKQGKTELGSNPFDWRSYGVFAFLAGVRNYSKLECITGETRGLPDDSEYLNTVLNEPQDFSYGGYSNGTARTKKDYYEMDADYHSHNYITLQEFLDFDYEKVFWDRRVSRTTHYPSGGSSTNGACLAEEGEGRHVSYREFLGEGFFDQLDDLKTLGEPNNVRVVFWFDN